MIGYSRELESKPTLSIFDDFELDMPLDRENDLWFHTTDITKKSIKN